MSGDARKREDETVTQPQEAIPAGLRSLVMLAVGLVAAVVAPVAVFVVYALHSLLWVALVAAAGWVMAGVTARAALACDRGEWRVPEYPVSRLARHPFLIMNPKSGGRGADLLGVAGGDGTQALVAGIAAEHGIPFMVITAGTRNHFALDLGLDRDNPPACLGALYDAVELRVDLGVAGGRTFVNNASFGAYAEVVDAPAYRDDKLRTTLELLPDLLRGHRGPRLTAHADGAEISAPQALLVANNPYRTGDIAGLGRRTRLDRGVLGVVAVTVNTARQAADLIRERRAAGLRVLTAHEITITADTRRLPVGIDGEAVSLPVPVRCAVRPGALRVWVPRDRTGVPAPKPEVNWARLRHLAGWGHGPRPAGFSAAGHAPPPRVLK
jgi:diacylglycerol kinase family enzyme